ncbi:CAP domain-containing protein (plasmid) [Cupriavidus pinatubonensis]|uniref:CAP domain-containing protein n=1 Tax=Cupriavidus pinatubonensis TaxID=248026 RepID=UPI001C73CEF7|nr:CAP domain-containing protein [Cupriavidus pinatubonensis]QYY33632.1 CAP domain-containing protein [Cupriavidus pinatubonensis]
MKKSLVAIAALSALLSACGGGGDSGGGTSSTPASGGSTSPAVTPPPPSSVAPATSAPTPTYASADQRLSAFSALNTVRSKMGVGMLKQDTILDQAAENHLTYAKTNSVMSHTETQGQAGFTGVTPFDQVVAAGGSRSQWIGQEMGQAGYLSGAECVAGWLHSVYHLQGATSNQENVGIAFHDNYCVVNFAVVTGANGGGYGLPQWGGQQLPTNAVAYYPLDNDSVVGSFNPATESPNPAADLTSAGTPIMFRVGAPQSTDVLTVSSFTLTGPGGASVPVRVLVPSAAKSGSMSGAVADSNLYAGVVFMLPTQPLAAGMYTATFSGARNGTSISKSWSFSAF